MSSIIDEYKREISKIDDKIKSVQEQCSHPDSVLHKKYKGSSGNYDPSCDGYWINWHCQLCDKKWTTDQDAIYWDRGIEVK